MSNRLNSISVSLVSNLLILGYYLVNILPIFQRGEWNPEDVFRLWVIVVVASIVLNILGNIIAAITINVAHAIKTNSNQEVRLLNDERDKLIELKGVRVAYFTSSIGIFLSMLSFVLDQPALVMFSLLLLFSLIAEILGDVSQFYFYNRGS
jgi:hypothetical protein